MLFKGGYGLGQRLMARDFLVLGLITFWIYPVVRLVLALNAHFTRRWSEVEARHELRGTDPRLAALRAAGFTLPRAAPWAAAAFFASSAVFAASRAAIASAAFFYAGALLLMLWTLTIIRRHEMLELHVRERGAGALLERPEPGDDNVRRWERLTNYVVAFLVVSIPMLFSPAAGVHPGIALALLAAFHVWGSVLLVRLYNEHLAEEERHAVTAPVRPGEERAAPDADAPPRRARVAIMLTDMQGYSKSMGLDESGAYARLVEHNRIMRAAIAAHRGREIKTIGDAFLVIFRGAVNAVQCALAAQRAFAEYNAGKRDDEKILVRIGLHVGEVILTASDIFGDDVNLVARIEPLAAPGGVCLSEPVLSIARNRIRLDVEPVEGATLKNIASPPKLFRIRGKIGV
ncbi:MAG TPA: adenylate/guanylate cyclase domain-containing protein [Burkholderiales bacterium]|nr:adenylate/guanylate cyclase domain-containing protein [Burkholderiales bacterium]